MTSRTIIREAVGVFKDKEELETAIAELEMNFARQDISVLAGQSALKKKYGKDAIGPEKVEDRPDAPRSIAILPEEVALGKAALIGGLTYIGGCAAAITASSLPNVILLTSIAAGSLAGAALGVFIIMGINARFDRHIRKQIKKGGLVVWVRTADRKQERLACSILKKCGGRHVHVHNIT